MTVDVNANRNDNVNIVATATTDHTTAAATATTTDSNNTTKSALTARIVSGAIGSLLTSLVVTPLEVVKVRTQAAAVTHQPTSSSAAAAAVYGNNVIPCPKGCGTFVMFNGHMDCIISKNSVPYFHQQPQPRQQLIPTTAICRSAAATGTTTTSAATASLATATTTNHNNLGTFSMIRRIFAQEGFSGIYAGLRPTLVMAVPNTVLYFTAYDEIVWRFRHNATTGSPQRSTNNLSVHNDEGMNINNRKERWWYPLVSGGLARLVSSTATAPLEFWKTRQAVASSTTEVSLQSIVRKEGVSVLYSGLLPTLWRDVPFSAIYWLSIEEFRLWWKQRQYDGYQPPPSATEQAAQAFINGAVAGMVAAACTTPMDVLKTRTQTSSALLGGGSASSTMGTSAAVAASACKHDGAIAYESLGTFQLLRHIALTEGVAGLWRGNQARMLKVAPGCAIMISSYEFGKRILE